MNEAVGKTIVQKYLKRMRIIHAALFGGILLIALFAFGLRQNPVPAFPAGGSVYVFLVPCAALAGYFAGTMIFRKLMGSLKASQDLSLRLARFQKASLLKYTCLEAATLLAVFAYLEEGYFLHLVIGAFLILYFYFQKPSRKQVLETVPLHPQERGLLDNAKRNSR